MISHKHKCIFIHIPKCAGTSIESALGHLDNFTGMGGQDHRSIRMIEQPYLTPKAFSSKENIITVHHRLRQQYLNKNKLANHRNEYGNVANHRNRYTVTKQQYKSYFKFTIIRNPWARAFSWYKNIMRADIHRKSHKMMAETSFKEFLIQFAGRKALRTQLSWIKSFDGSIPLDYIGRFENLSDDMHEVFKQLNIENITLPHELKGSEDDYREHYDDEENDLIIDIYKEEIAMFGYSLDSKCLK